MKVGQLDEAERWYQKALESKPDHIPAHITTARLLLKQVKKHQKKQQKTQHINTPPAHKRHPQGKTTNHIGLGLFMTFLLLC